MRKLPIFFVCDSPLHYYPLSIGLLRAAVASADFASQLHFFPLLSLPEKEILRVSQGFGPGIWFFSSYIWSEHRNLRLSAQLKSQNSNNVIVFGGPNCPKAPKPAEQFLRAHPQVDLMARGESEFLIVECIEQLVATKGVLCPEEMGEIGGMTARRGDSIWRGPDRSRILELDAIVSPYLSGIFDKLPIVGQIVETNRGCPYGCTFCDWGNLVQQKVKTFDLDRVKAEIEWGARKGIVGLMIADANFGILERDLEIAEFVVRMREKYGHPFMVGPTYAKNNPERVIEIVRIFQKGKVRSEALISIQTTDQETLRVVGRSNIKTSKYDELLHLMRLENLPVVTDLMVGLPGQSRESFKADLQLYFDRDVRVQIWPTLVLPNSQMADPDYQARHGIQQDRFGFVTTCHTFSSQDRSSMLWLRSLFLVSENYAYLRYLLRYLQWEEGLPALDVLEALVKEASGSHALAQFLGLLKPDETFADVWAAADVAHQTSFRFRHEVARRCADFYSELFHWLQRHYSLKNPNLVKLVLDLNRRVMPDADVCYPLTVEMAHDVVAYFSDRFQGVEKSLADYGPSTMVVRDPRSLSQLLPVEPPKGYAVREVVWELHSPLLDQRALPSDKRDARKSSFLRGMSSSVSTV